MATPARELRRAPRRPARSRPHLEVVGRNRRTRRPGARLAAGMLALFLVLFGNAVAHSVLVSGQERLDGLNARVEQEQARNQRLHLRAASLLAPDRIVEAAKDDGMVPADQVEWLPGDGSGSGAGSGGPVDPAAGEADTEELATGDGADTAGR